MKTIEHLFTTAKEKGQDRMLLTPFVEDSDIEAFLATFKTVMCFRVWEWAGCLVQLLTSNTRSKDAYMRVDAIATYSEVKQVILSGLEATVETSKVKLRKMKFQLKGTGKYLLHQRTDQRLPSSLQ